MFINLKITSNCSKTKSYLVALVTEIADALCLSLAEDGVSDAAEVRRVHHLGGGSRSCFISLRACLSLTFICDL